MVFATFALIIILFLDGYDYYQTEIESRFYHESHDLLKPSGSYGHGYGIFGSLFMLVGVGIYMLRKRVRAFSKIGQIKHWLEFHIFLCTAGPILVLFHTAMKFGGIVSISFWSMVAVFASGIIGRFIYIQIPRTIEGRELSLSELKDSQSSITEVLQSEVELKENTIDLISHSIEGRSAVKGSSLQRFIKKYQQDRQNLKKIKVELSSYNISKSQRNQIIKKIKDEIVLNRRIDRLNFMKEMFKYWHVAHLPFAVIMLVIMIIHVVVTLLFGYKWIF
jgi:hypothetical protein